jgi:hypothetical protein
MFCNNCGKEIKEGSKFCNKCGAAVDTNLAGADIVRPRTRPHLRVVFITLTVLLVAGAAAGAFLWFSPTSAEETPPDALAETTPTSTPTDNPTPSSSTTNTSTPTPTPPATSSFACEALYEVLKAAVDEYGIGDDSSEAWEWWDTEAIVYAQLIDFDNNKVPELFYMHWQNEAEGFQYYVYGCSEEGEARLLCKEARWGSTFFELAVNQIMGLPYLCERTIGYAGGVEGGGMMADTQFYYTLRDGKWTEVLSRIYIETYPGDGSTESSWTVNDNDVSEEEYDYAPKRELGITEQNEISTGRGYSYDSATVQAVLDQLKGEGGADIAYGDNVAPIYAPAPAPVPDDANGNKKGDVIAFGGYSWRILAIGEGQNLLISENILEYRVYNEKAGNVTWEECTLRDYLNNVFINNFSADEQARIVETLVVNGDNLYTNREGGNDTSDRIFLLSLDEAVRYFDAGEGYYYGSGSGYNTTGKAYDTAGNAAAWWLRSPSFRGGAAAVYDDGGVYAGGGYCVDSDQGNPDRHGFGYPICANIGVRPALWLKV